MQVPPFTVLKKSQKIQIKFSKAFSTLKWPPQSSDINGSTRCSGTEDSQHEHVADKPAATRKNIGLRISKLNL